MSTITIGGNGYESGGHLAMKVHEVLALYRKLLATMTRQGVSSDDIRYLDLFNEYQTMKANGAKRSDICDFLSQKHKASTSTIKTAVRRLEEEYEL